MFSYREKQLFLVLVLSLVVAIVALMGVAQFGPGLVQETGDEDREEVLRQNESGEREARPADRLSPWVVYQNEKEGFRFEYLRAYDENRRFFSCRVRQDREGSFAMGEIGINIVSARGLETSEAFVEDFFTRRTGPPYNWEVERRLSGIVSARESVRAAYRFGEEKRYAEAVFVPGGERMFILSFAEGDFRCNETEAFERLLQTFRVVEKKQ